MQHSKLHVLVYGEFVRIIISSANQGIDDWNGVGQVVWVCDFFKKSQEKMQNSQNPPKKQKLSSSSSSASRPPLSPPPSAYSFAQDLQAFVVALTRSSAELCRHWCELLNLYDLSVSSNVALVASVPGVYHEDEYPRCVLITRVAVLSVFCSLWHPGLCFWAYFLGCGK